MIILVTLIPSALFVSSETHKQITPPPFFEAIDIQVFAETYNFTLTNVSDSNTGYVDFGGWRFSQAWDFGDTPDWRASSIARYDSFAVGPVSFTWFVEWGWFYRDNFLVDWRMYASRLDSDYIDDGLNGLKYLVKFGETTQFYMFFAFNETTYSSPELAWEQSDLRVLWGINFDQVNTGYSAWDLISMLLFFNLPTVHILINALIAIPLWIAIIYLTFILILRAIGAVFGGGA